MLATFKETITSLQDKTYGAKIVLLPWPKVVWYWTKYLLLFSLIPLVLVIAGFTHFIPQFPRLAKDRLPDGEINLRNGRLSTTISQPFSVIDPQFAFILNTEGAPVDLDQYPSGLLILSDRIIVKTSAGATQTRTFERLPDFSLAKSQIVDWLSGHQFFLWFLAVLAALAITCVINLFFWVYKMISFLFWGLILLFVARLLKKPLTTFTGGFNLAVYASVLPLLLSSVILLAPNQILSFFSFGLFAYYSLSWLVNLSQTNPPSPAKPEKPRKTSNK